MCEWLDRLDAGGRHKQYISFAGLLGRAWRERPTACSVDSPTPTPLEVDVSGEAGVLRTILEGDAAVM
jgi:hypothetical protein